MNKLQTLNSIPLEVATVSRAEPPKLKIGHTPIEIALGIDEQGRTTAKKLYAFLELAIQNYARWCRGNITENDFAEENVDYFHSSSMKNEQGRGKFAEDYILTATFAKKLAMTSNSVKGEQARDYFIKIEEKLKEIAITIASQRAMQNIQITQQKVTLDEIFVLDELQAKTRYNIGRNWLLEVADEAGAIIRIGRKNGYLRKRLDDYFENHAT